MKKTLFISLVSLFSLFGSNVKAQNFIAINDYGDSILYWKTSDSTVRVGGFYGAFEDTSTRRFYTGNLVIPSNVNYNGHNYIVNEIMEFTFFRSKELISVVMPNTIENISYLAFYECTSLQSVTISNSVSLIESRTFTGCRELKSITLPNSIKFIADDAFAGCSSLESINLSSNLTGIYTAAFSNCVSLKSVYIPDAIQSIWNYAFGRCNNLKFISLGKNLSQVEYLAFDKSFNIDTILSNSIIPPHVFNHNFTSDADSFSEINHDSIVLLTPCGTLDAYRAVEAWNNFSNIQENCVGLDEVVTENNISIYPNPAKDILNIKVDKLNKGYLFVYDVMGKEVLSQQITKDELSVDVRSLASGVYMIKIFDKDNRNTNIKFVKQ